MPAPVETAAPRNAGAPSLASRSGAIKIDVASVPFAAAPPTKRYWVGVMPDAPLDNASAGPITFLKFKGSVPLSENERKFDLSKPHTYGDVIELTDDMLAVIRKRVANKVVRLASMKYLQTDHVGNKTEHEKQYVFRYFALDSVVYDVQKDRKGEPSPPRPYQPERSDVPLGYFLYMIPISESMPYGWREQTPERMCDKPSMYEALAR